MGEITGPNGTVYTVPIVNTQTHISEVLHELAKEHTFAVAWWEDGKTRKYSLRVDAKTNFDGTIIARHHKGGGHAKACGWTECVK
jgi:nanoRNase/pAp phosphatase (c-di-AMP/oligoRNAs hydrolase)